MRKSGLIKNSILYSLVIRFVFLIIIPILCIWWIYGKILQTEYDRNYFAAQQSNLDNSKVMLESIITTTLNAFTVLEGNSEIKYYIDDGKNKELMPYADYIRLSTLTRDVQEMTIYLEDIVIYSDSELLIYAWPFVDLNKTPLEEDLISELDNADIGDVIWRIVASSDGEIPRLYAYKKIYADVYFKEKGYLEIELSQNVFKDYFAMLCNILGSEQVTFSLYHNATSIFSSSKEKNEITYVEDAESSFMPDKDFYRNYIKIPELDVCIECSGRISDLHRNSTDNRTSKAWTFSCVLMLVLLGVFFVNIFNVSKRILAFAKFIQASEPEELHAFQPKELGKKSDEITVLIKTYNMLIMTNNSLISRVQRAELFSKEAKLQMLQSQIHPHFMYGTLESIRMVALQHADKEVAELIYALATLLRYSVSINGQEVALRTELDVAKHYMNIQKIRLGERIEYEVRVEEKLLEIRMPSMILQPIIENAIVYGVSGTLDACKITVDVYEKDSYIIISVSNDGLLITEQRMKEVNKMLSGEITAENFRGNGNGVALRNIRDRLVLFFGGAASIQLKLQEGQTVTMIQIEQ